MCLCGRGGRGVEEGEGGYLELEVQELTEKGATGRNSRAEPGREGIVGNPLSALVVHSQLVVEVCVCVCWGCSATKLLVWLCVCV